MNLKDIRKWFVQESGRYDLVTDQDEWADNGADKYINAAQRWLDRKSVHQREVARVFTLIEPEDYFIFFKDARVVQDVWVGNSTDGMRQLEKKTYAELRKIYREPLHMLDRGAPLYFAPAYIRPANENEPTFDGRLDLMDVMVDWKTYNGIFLLPPADQEYQVEVWGKFFSDKLIEDEDDSYWTAEDPGILIKACLRELEIFYRNTTGVNDWTRAIESDLLGVEFDFVEDDSQDVTELGG